MYWFVLVEAWLVVLGCGLLALDATGNLEYDDDDREK